MRGELWVVNTLFSCLCTLDGVHNFVPQWKPRFITAIRAEDRCHLNGLAVVDGRPRYLSALGETDTREGWRPGKATGGCLIDIASGEAVVRGLCMPHSPRVHDGQLMFLESGRGRLVRADQSARPSSLSPSCPDTGEASLSPVLMRSSAFRGSGRPPSRPRRSATCRYPRGQRH